MDNEFVDVAIPRGCLPRESRVGESEWPNFSETGIDAVPRSEWKDLLEVNRSLEEIVGATKDQNGEGSCASNSATQCMEIAWNMTFGLDHWIQFSPISVYRWVSNSPNNGSTIEGNLRQIREVGCLPSNIESNIPLLEEHGFDTEHVLKNVGYYQKFPNDWKETAKNFRADEWYEITSFDEFITALWYDFPVSYGRAGHAICGVTPVYKDGQWHVKYINSWGDWGFEDELGRKGYGLDSERYISGSISSYGAWALRSVVIPPLLLP